MAAKIMTAVHVTSIRVTCERDVDHTPQLGMPDRRWAYHRGAVNAPLNIDRDAWRALELEKRRLRAHGDATIADRLRRGQRLSAQAAALRRSIVRDEPAARRP
jgi:hypothetical protein